MGLKIPLAPDGTPRTTWFGRISVKGHVSETNLGVPVRGTVPLDAYGRVRLSARGDELFEKSRAEAEKALARWRAEARKSPAYLQEKALRAITREKAGGVPFDKLIERWKAIPRQRPVTAERTRCAASVFKAFGAFARKRTDGRCLTLDAVTPDLAAAWFASIRKTYAWGTVKDMMHTMAGAFTRWATVRRENPFKGVIMRGGKAEGEERARTGRDALTAEQFDRLRDLVRENARLWPLFVTAAYTGMRLGDVCHLTAADVDLGRGVIDCITSKAGVRVRIPIMSPDLREVLDARCAVPADGSDASPYLFPWAAEQYDHETEGEDAKRSHSRRASLVRSIKPYFARAVYADAEAEDVPDEPRPIEEAVEGAGFTEQKRARVLEVYRRFKAGEVCSDIALAMGIARGQVSNYLKDAETLTGETLRPRGPGKATAADLIEKTRVGRTVGKYAASKWGWHNLRHHFITCALNAGVPVEKVAQIVGHKTVAMTVKYADMRTDTRAVAALPAPSVPRLGCDADGARRRLALKRAALTVDEGARMEAVLAAAGVDADADAARADALTDAALLADAGERVRAVLAAAGEKRT